MARGIYSALGWWAETGQLQAVCEQLGALGRAADRGERPDDVDASLPEPARAAVTRAVTEIRSFEARVGQPCGFDAEIVRTPSGPAIELGNRDHLAFGAEHEDAAAAVARSLAAVLDAFGALRTVWLTCD